MARGGWLNSHDIRGDVEQTIPKRDMNLTKPDKIETPGPTPTKLGDWNLILSISPPQFLVVIDLAI